LDQAARTRRTAGHDPPYACAQDVERCRSHAPRGLYQAVSTPRIPVAFRITARGAAGYIAGMTSELTTPDGRYLVIQGRLWRAPNPTLPVQAKVKYMRDLLNGRRALKAAKTSGDEEAITAARKLVARAQVGLGERGPVWWSDGSPDLNRTLARNSPYAEWFARAEAQEQPARAA
jgi:hypothetical protein